MGTHTKNQVAERHGIRAAADEKNCDFVVDFSAQVAILLSATRMLQAQTCTFRKTGVFRGPFGALHRSGSPMIDAGCASEFAMATRKTKGRDPQDGGARA